MTPQTQELIRNCLVGATLLPLLSSTVLILIGKRWLGRCVSSWGATLAMGASMAMAIIALAAWMQAVHPQPILWQKNWIPIPGNDTGWLHMGLLADSLTVVLMVMVSGISFLVHLYSIGYMKGDDRFERFFAYLSLFTFSMLGIVTAAGLTQLFVMWELVGLTSYLLIGFWHERRGPQLASKKAWVMNRIGDAGFIIGFGILFFKLSGNVLLPAAQGALSSSDSLVTMFGAIEQVLATESDAASVTYSFTNPPLWLTAAGIALFFGAIGKSAQFPLHTWLPDAMEGPTPVSSIVHSATMVAAGVYLTARIYPILTPGAHLFVATIGLITLVIAAAMAMVMTDIKRVLAYSTLSQLGYMILALGAGAYSFALFHLVTHAFFKCCLFQCSGSVINAAHHEQDMRQYGGLRRKLPITAFCYFVCTLAIAGASIPWTVWGISGFYSKDGIIAGTVNYGHAMYEMLGIWAHLFWLGPTVVAYVTVFYMARSFSLTFLGKPRNLDLHAHAHEAPWTMLLPQLCLAAMAVLTAPFILGFWKDLIVISEPQVAWMQTAANLEHGHAMEATHGYLLHGMAWIIMLVLGIVMYLPGMAVSSHIVKIPPINLLYKWAYNKFYFDGLYDIFTVNLFKFIALIAGTFDKYIVDGQIGGIWPGLVNGPALLIKKIANGIGLFDNKVVDGMVNGAANAAQSGGQLLRNAQPGRVRVYVLLLFTAAALIAFVVLTTVTVNASQH